MKVKETTNARQAKKLTLVVMLAISLVLALCVGFTMNSTKKASAEVTPLGEITVINHDDNQIGIKIKGVSSPSGGVLHSAQDAPFRNPPKLCEFFNRLMFNGQPLFNTVQKKAPVQYAEGYYNLGGYNYIIASNRIGGDDLNKIGYEKGDVIYFAKGFRPMISNTTDGNANTEAEHVLAEQELQYDKYFVFDGYEFLPGKVLLDITSPADSVVVNNTLALTPKFLPIKLYATDDRANKVNAWDIIPDKDPTWYKKTYLSKAITYTSSDESIATVDANTGVITGVKTGKVNITATHVNSNDSVTKTFVVKGSAVDLGALSVEAIGGKPVIASGISGSAMANVAIADNAFFNQVTLNGEKLFASGVSAALAADGKVSVNRALVKDDIICVKAGFQPITSTDGVTAVLADKALAKDVYYKYDGAALTKVAPFTLDTTTLAMQVRESKEITPVFEAGISDRDIVWSSSADYMINVDQTGKLQARNYATGSENIYVTKGNASAPTSDAKFPDSVTITARHIGTGETSTISVTIAETIENMKMEVKRLSPTAIGFNFTGIDSGRKVSYDAMPEAQSRINRLPFGEDGRVGRNWDRHHKFYIRGFLNNGFLANAEYGGRAVSTNLGNTNYPVIVNTNSRNIIESDILIFKKGFRPFGYTKGVGYYLDNMCLASDVCFKLVDGEYVEMLPYSLDKQAYGIKIGTTKQTTKTLRNAEYTAAWDGVDTAVTYTIADTAIATVDVNGLITAVSKGKTTLTLSNAYGAKEVADVYVFEEGNVTLDETKTIELGDTVTINSNATDGSGEFVWSSSAADVVGITGKGVTADIVASKLGKSTITVTYNTDKATSTMVVTVVPKLTIDLPIDKNNVGTIAIGKDVQVATTVNPVENVTVSYSSSDTDYATISETGLIKAIKAGKKVTFTVTAALNGAGNEAIKSVKTFELKTYAQEPFSFSKIDTSSDGFQLWFDGAKASINYTENVGWAINDVNYKDDLPEFFQNLKLTQTIGTAGAPVTFNEYWHSATGHQIQIHARPEFMEFHWYDYDPAAEKPWTPAEIEDGTKVTFEKGFRPVWGNNKGTYYANHVLDEKVEYVYTGGKWREVIAEGAPFRIINVDPMNAENEFMITFNVDTTTADDGQIITDIEKIKFCGYTVKAINAANTNGAILVFANDTISVKLDPKVVMDGKKIFARDGGDISFEIEKGYALPTSYTCGETYSSTFYSSVSWWAEAPIVHTSTEKLSINKVVTSSESAAAAKAFNVIFANENKIFAPINSGAAGIGSVHVNAVAEWLTKTNFYPQLSHQIASGAKVAVWDGIYLNGRSVRDIMFKSGAATTELQSTIVAVHFNYSLNTMRFVFDDRCADINGLDWEKKITMRIDSEKFQTDTGAKFDADVIYSYNPTDKTWAQEYIYSVTMDETKTVEAGKTVTINAASNVVSGPSTGDTALVWTTSDAAIATVKDGVVTAIKAGSVNITATAIDGTSKTCAVTVTAPEVKPDPTPDPKPAKKGCNSVVSLFDGASVASIIFIIALLAVISFVSFKRKKV